MGKIKDLTGKRVGKLLVVSRSEDHIEKSGKHKPQWLCQCDCGGIIVLKSRQLNKGNITCCDNCNPKKRRIHFKLNLVGKKFGKWTVLKEVMTSRTRSGHSRWLCQCECGIIREVDGGHLSQGKSTSCGCSKIENTTAIDITRRKFGRWTAIEKVGKDKGNNILWKCICDCGTESVLTAHALLSGNSMSCGCLKKEKAHARRENLIGKKFNMLTVIEKADDHIYPSGAHRPMYKCLCDCGREVTVLSSSLKRGTSKSCGCLLSHGEKIITEILEKNRINFTKQKMFEGLVSDKGCNLRFDFYINNNYLIEFDGMYHYKASNRIWCTEEHVKRTQYHDKLKNNFCRDKSIPLIRIPYTHVSAICLEDLLLETTKFRVV